MTQNRPTYGVASLSHVIARCQSQNVGYALTRVALPEVHRKEPEIIPLHAKRKVTKQ